ncbi:MAG TPA: ComF family protein [Thermoanaerobaculia bacterium]|nr:ComF family protein [Thermoanaerobaculia bacterium]
MRIVLPARCVGCGGELPWRGRTTSCCAACWSALPRIAGPKCRSCALPIPDGEHCIACLENPLPLDWCEAWGHYRGPLERVLHALKFERHDFYDAPLARLIASVLRDRDFDVITCVPASRARERRRGYNQAELLARALAERIGIRCDPALLVKRAEREAQSKLRRVARSANVRGAFAASPEAKARRVLLVDDICTTGATLRACAAALRREEAARVCAIAVARA